MKGQGGGQLVAVMTLELAPLMESGVEAGMRRRGVCQTQGPRSLWQASYPGPWEERGGADGGWGGKRPADMGWEGCHLGGLAQGRAVSWCSIDRMGWAG